MTDRLVRGLVLVRCEPYRAHLQSASCADRWRAMAGTSAHAPPGNAAIARAAKMKTLALCAGCRTGEARSAALARREEGGRDE